MPSIIEITLLQIHLREKMDCEGNTCKCKVDSCLSCGSSCIQNTEQVRTTYNTHNPKVKISNGEFFPIISWFSLIQTLLHAGVSNFKPTTIGSHTESTSCCLNGCSNTILCQKQKLIVSGPFMYFISSKFWLSSPTLLTDTLLILLIYPYRNLLICRFL